MFFGSFLAHIPVLPAVPSFTWKFKCNYAWFKMKIDHWAFYSKDNMCLRLNLCRLLLLPQTLTGLTPLSSFLPLAPLNPSETAAAPEWLCSYIPKQDCLLHLHYSSEDAGPHRDSNSCLCTRAWKYFSSSSLPTAKPRISWTFPQTYCYFLDHILEFLLSINRNLSLKHCSFPNGKFWMTALTLQRQVLGHQPEEWKWISWSYAFVRALNIMPCFVQEYNHNTNKLMYAYFVNVHLQRKRLFLQF
jgi:hypothetical protein